MSKKTRYLKLEDILTKSQIKERRKPNLFAEMSLGSSYGLSGPEELRRNLELSKHKAAMAYERMREAFGLTYAPCKNHLRYNH